jgi:hypothetical protein
MSTSRAPVARFRALTSWALWLSRPPRTAYRLTPLRDRHLTDLAVLAAMIRRNDNIATQLTKRDRDHLAVGIRGLAEHRSLWVGIDGAERGVDLLSAFIKRI